MWSSPAQFSKPLLRPYFGVPAAYSNEAGTQACEFNSLAMVRLRLPRLLLDPCFVFNSKPMLPGERRALTSATTALSSTILLLEVPVRPSSFSSLWADSAHICTRARSLAASLESRRTATSLKVRFGSFSDSPTEKRSYQYSC